jgi:hypothetical protein
MLAINSAQGNPDTSLSWIIYLLVLFLLLASVVGFLTDRMKRRSSSETESDAIEASPENIRQKMRKSLRRLNSQSTKKSK